MLPPGDLRCDEVGDVFGRVAVDYITSRGDKNLLTIAAEAQAHGGHDILAVPFCVDPHEPLGNPLLLLSDLVRHGHQLDVHTDRYSGAPVLPHKTQKISSPKQAPARPSDACSAPKSLAGRVERRCHNKKHRRHRLEKSPVPRKGPRSTPPGPDGAFISENARASGDSYSHGRRRVSGSRRQTKPFAARWGPS
jgi:hypothetical protein